MLKALIIILLLGVLASALGEFILGLGIALVTTAAVIGAVQMLFTPKELER